MFPTVILGINHTCYRCFTFLGVYFNRGSVFSPGEAGGASVIGFFLGGFSTDLSRHHAKKSRLPFLLILDRLPSIIVVQCFC